MESKRQDGVGDGVPDLDVGTTNVGEFAMGDRRFLVVQVPLVDRVELSSLTASEREVARLAAAGLSNSAIASRRGTSERTTANQMAAILRKLRVGSRYALAAYMALAPLHPPETR